MTPPIVRAGQDGRCGICDEPIFEGDPIVVVEEEWCHVECADLEDWRRDEEEDLPLV